MSTKNKVSSKNKKAPSKKVASKKVAPKKAVAKKAAPKPAKKAANKKAVTPVKKTAAKPVAKKTVAKKPAKAPAKKVLKPVAKKAVAKPVKKSPVKAKKAAPKKVVKATPKKTAKPVKKVTKPVPVKKAAPKAPAKAVKKVAPVAVKKVKSAPAPKAPIKKASGKHEVKPLHSKTSTVKEIKHIIEEVVDHKPEKAVKAPKPSKTKVAPVPVKKQIVAPTTFRKTESEAPVKFVKEPNGKFEMEFVIRASEDMVFEFVSTESGLSEWFCDDVNIRDGVFTFNWDGQIQQARLVKEIPPLSIRYQWLDKNDGSYFEFRTQKDELTNDISLIITDFASDKAEEASARLLWSSQVDKLLHVLGSFF